MNMHIAEGTVEIGRSLLRALSNTGISVVYQDPALRVIWSQNVPASWSEGDLVGRTDAEFLPADEATRLVAIKERVLATGQPETLELRVEFDGAPYWYDLWIDADRWDEAVVGVITTAVDISEQKRREQTLRTLLREVSHRSKNLLAIIQSIATQTGRHATTVEGFLSRFRGRIQSLAASQDLVTSSNWRGADLGELIAGQVGRYAGDPSRAIAISGVNPYLTPNAALHIGLALHELAVNSVSYGALARADGRVDIASRIDAGPSGANELVLVWTEQIDAAADGAQEKRFGTAALERVVPTSLNGRANLEMGNGTLVYTLHVPESNFDSQ
ncbi:MAG: PAS domain-containing protein [Rhizobiaceae bacterium]|nr:PAS domain-containing protein [Rhizobiaceae bacterium]